MRYLKKFEDINIPIKVGDTILGGRFKNKKIVVKKIGKNKKGDITVNDKPLLKFRLLKESVSNDVLEYLKHLEDDGFVVECFDYFIRIFKPKHGDSYTINNLSEFNFSEIVGDVSRFIEYIGDEFNGGEFTDIGYTIANIFYSTSDGNSLSRNYLEFRDILLNKSLDFNLLSFNIRYINRTY